MSQLNYRPIITELARFKIAYVLTGSVAAGLYGVPVNPGDFDIAPELSQANLARLAEMLREWGAKPSYIPNWEAGLTLEQIERWQPDPPTAEQLDHLMVTPYGKLDIVPHISGEYHDLMQRAISVRSFSTTIFVAHIDDLIATMKPKAAKHIERMPHMLNARQRFQSGSLVVSLESLVK